MGRDVPAQVGLVHAIDRNQEHVLGLPMSIGSGQSARWYADRPEESGDGYCATSEDTAGCSSSHDSSSDAANYAPTSRALSTLSAFSYPALVDGMSDLCNDHGRFILSSTCAREHFTKLISQQWRGDCEPSIGIYRVGTVVRRRRSWDATT